MKDFNIISLECMKTMQKLFFIFQVWNELFSALDGFRAAEIYRSQLTKQFVDRAAKVKSLVLLLMLSVIPLKENFCHCAWFKPVGAISSVGEFLKVVFVLNVITE